MTKTLLLAALGCLVFQVKTLAQFGNTPEVISRSTNTSLFQVSATDLDGDGDNDVLGTYQNCLVWYENLDGKGSFSVDRIFMELGFASYTPNLFGAKAEDLDGDGLPDVAADRFWRKNLGGGNFAPRVPVFTSSLATLCDVDGDQLPDAINVDNAKIYWQRNLGAGSFAARQIIKNAPMPNICCAKDLNFDGKMDLVARHSGGTFWYKNLGASQFDSIRILNAQHVNLEFLDFDADGKMDIFTTNGTAIFWYEMDLDGTTTLLQTVTETLFEGGALAVGDLNNDGFPDIFAGSTSGLGERARYFPFNPATGKFASTPLNHNIYLISHGWATFTNLDGDAEPDILATTTYGFGWMKKIAPTQFSAVFNITQKLDIPKEILSSDFENDGDLDLFAEGYVFRNLGSGNYAEKQKSAESGSRTFRGDLDGDGLKDLARPFGDSISWRKNLGTGQFSQPILLPGLVTSCKEIGGGDLDADGDLDLFAANGTDALAVNARFYWFENDGKGHFVGHLLESGIQLCSGAFALDVNEDGKLDMVLTFFNGNNARWYPNLGGGNFDPPKALFNGLPSPTNVNQTMLTDLDADGRIDYIYSTKTTTLTKVAWFRNLGNSTFDAEKPLVQMSHQGSYATPYFTVFDATLDGLPDLIVSDNYWNRFHLLPSAGNGKFGASKVVYDESDFGDVFGVVGHDVDGDGRLDLVYGNRTENLNTQGYAQLSWLRNLHPQPVVPFAVNEKSATCSDNQTPADAHDDFLTISLKIKGFDNSSTRFVLSNFKTGAVVDTFFYDEKIQFQLPPGSAGDGVLKEFKIQDLVFQDTFLVVGFDAGQPCSPAAPAEISILNIQIECRDNGTPNDPTDDKLVFWLTPNIFNPPVSTAQYNINSNFGWAINPANFSTSGKYLEETYFELPEGSAVITGQLVLTLEDSKNFGLQKQFVFDVPGTCSAAPLPCPLSIYYHKQSEIDSFSIKYPGCRVLAGDLTLNELLPDAGVPSIENLLGFRQLLEVRGDVNIGRTHLSNLTGLDSLQRIGRDLSVLFFNSPSLESLVGLSSLRKIGRDFWLSDTAATLKNWAGLEHLDSIGVDLNLFQMGGVKNFEGLKNLKSAGILAHHCAALENLKGLENLESANTVSLTENPNLKSLDGLENLKTIAGDPFSVLRLAKNPLLDDLSALDREVSIPALEIWENPQLSACAVQAICLYLKNFDPAKTEIIDNLTNCNSILEVQNKCIVSAEDLSQSFDFQLLPNPVSEGEALRIFWRNDFSGNLKIEILSLDGRVLSTLLKEKTASNLIEVLNLDELPNSFFVRVSDEKRSVTRLVLKP